MARRGHRGASGMTETGVSPGGDFLQRYHGQRVALLTQHGKEALLGPLFHAELGCRVERVTGFDTDTLGTFTREIPREGSQLDAARRKARVGMDLGRCGLGLASEGAFGPDPFSGLLPWNVELVLMVDDEARLEVVGMAQGPACNANGTLHESTALRDFAEKAGFPAHHLVVRPDDEHQPVLAKGIRDWSSLEACFQEALARSRTGKIWIESDLRAHCNPTRQQVIRDAGANLLARLRSSCPGCARPGFWRSGQRTGLPCVACWTPTGELLAEIWSCASCGHQHERSPTSARFADPSRCNACNP